MNRLKYLMEGFKAAFRFSKALDLAAEGNNEKSLEHMNTVPEFVLVRHSKFCALKTYLCFELADNTGLQRAANCLGQCFMRSDATPDDIHMAIYALVFLEVRGIENKIITEYSILNYDPDLVSESTQRNFPLLRGIYETSRVE